VVQITRHGSDDLASYFLEYDDDNDDDDEMIMMIMI
jgi:hypothetical protein